MKHDDNTVLITQMDYAKILIEDERYGEASDIIYTINDIIDNKVKKIADTMHIADLEIPKSLVKTKSNEWKLLNNNWVKFKSISKENVTLYLNRNNIIEKQYKINKKAI